MTLQRMTPSYFDQKNGQKQAKNEPNGTRLNVCKFRKTEQFQSMEVLDCTHDGMDRPALPVLPSPAHAPRPDLHGDDHHRCGAARRPRAAHGLLAGRASSRAPA